MCVRGLTTIKWKDSVLEYLRGKEGWRLDALIVRGRPPIKCKDSVGILEGEEGWRGMESGCCGCERKTTYKM